MCIYIYICVYIYNGNQYVTQFVSCNLWSWARLYIGEESLSLIGFLEWLAST